MTPFLTFYTPTYRRPRALAACLRSVQEQTAVHDIEQVVVVDHLGVGVGGMFTRMPHYVGAVHGQYVHVLADDDVLASPTVVAEVRAFARAHGDPPLILVRVDKDGMQFPIGQAWPPVCGQIDLGCLVPRADVWRAHVDAYGDVYEGDYHFADALAQAGVEAAVCPVLFLSGEVLRGRAEPDLGGPDTGGDVPGGGAI